MDKLLLSLLIGLAAGVVDIVPMLIQKLPKRATLSAFFHYLFVSVVIVNISLPHVAWWLQGGIISLALTTPMLIALSATEKKSLPIIMVNAAVIGTLVGVAGHYLA